MFTKVGNLAFFAILILFSNGCFGGYSVNDGLDVSEIVYLNDAHEVEFMADVGDVFGLDMVSTVAAGHSVSGVSFDPELFRMERYITYEDDGESRTRYLFTAVADGAGAVTVKMRPASGGKDVVHWTVKVVVGGDSGTLF